MNYRTDEETKVRHIECSDHSLCGLSRGWTVRGDKPGKRKWGSTCPDCIAELEDLRRIKKED